MKLTHTQNSQQTKSKVPLLLVRSNSVQQSNPPNYSGKDFLCAHIGTSMNPTLSALDLLEVEPYNQKKPKIGDVILLKLSTENLYVVHRIVKTSQSRYLTRGDNSTEVDPWILNRKKILGSVIAAQQGNKRRKIAGGFIGRLTGLSCLVRRKTSGLLVKILRPAYRPLCSGGFLHWLVPVRLTPQVATFQSGTNASHKLLLGKRIIGSYDESLLQWQIKRPYRLFVNENSLPRPR